MGKQLSSLLTPSADHTGKVDLIRLSDEGSVLSSVKSVQLFHSLPVGQEENTLKTR